MLGYVYQDRPQNTGSCALYIRDIGLVFPESRSKPTSLDTVGCKDVSEHTITDTGPRANIGEIIETWVYGSRQACC